ncbi:MAG: NADP-dependent oxidoreductase [Alphaproteobacteria bacterium]|nr:NADP-dependent oxidoreductase [Alphaproteobacteria bacterium]
MKAIFYTEFGPADILQLGQRPKPVPKAGQVLVRVAAAVNPIDRRLRAGELQNYFTRQWPIIPGWDFSGRIEEVGADVSGWQVGDDVVGLAFSWFLSGGTYGEYVAVDATAIALKPQNISFVEGAVLPLVSLTAWQALVEYCAVKPGQSVLIQAGAGGLGSVAVSLAKYLGAQVYTTTRAKNFDYVTARGADYPIDYTAQDPVTVILQQQPDGLDAVLASLESDNEVRAAIQLVKSGGAVAYMNNDPPDMPEIAAKNIRAEFLHNRPDGACLGKIMTLYAQGKLMLPEIEVMPLEAAARAHKRSESWGTRGKIALHIQDI